MRNPLSAKDIVSGQEGTAFMNINGRNVDMFYLKSIDTTVTMEKASVKTLGRRGEQHKTIGWSGSGSMTVFAVTSEFIEIALDYIKNGRVTYFDIKTTNEDPNSSIGRQSVLIRDVTLDEIPLSILDTESDFLEQDLSFTYEDVELLEKFRTPTTR